MSKAKPVLPFEPSPRSPNRNPPVWPSVEVPYSPACSPQPPQTPSTDQSFSASRQNEPVADSFPELRKADSFLWPNSSGMFFFQSAPLSRLQATNYDGFAPDVHSINCISRDQKQKQTDFPSFPHSGLLTTGKSNSDNERASLYHSGNSAKILFRAPGLTK